MQSLFTDTRILDKAAREAYGLSEEVMMENAAAALESSVLQAEAKKIVILCGSGNNGADGYALARRLSSRRAADGEALRPLVIALVPPKSDLCKLQAERAKKCGVECLSTDDMTADAEKNLFSKADLIADCIFGSGFHGNLDEKSARLCRLANESEAVRIACDLPTGLREDGTVAEGAFSATKTVTMGALKCSLYSDEAKDIAGQVVCENLGISRALFEAAAPESDGKVSAFLLEAGDLHLPHRKQQKVNKGSFGHVAVASGEKIGASCLAGQAALHFGAGLVTLVRLGSSFDKTELPQVTPELMTSGDFPANTSALALGMGLGRSDEKIQPYLDWLSEHKEIPCLLDADALYASDLQAFLKARTEKSVLTPHPKEFQALLHNLGLGDYSIADCLNRRPQLIEYFCRTFPQCVLLVKGANPMIGHFDGSEFRLYVNPLGSNALAKAGSGDVLAGLITALLAQGCKSLDAAINGSLAHALASQAFKNDYSLTPLSLIEAVARL